MLFMQVSQQLKWELFLNLLSACGSHFPIWASLSYSDLMCQRGVIFKWWLPLLQGEKEGLGKREIGRRGRVVIEM